LKDVKCEIKNKYFREDEKIFKVNIKGNNSRDGGSGDGNKNSQGKGLFYELSQYWNKPMCLMADNLAY
jgi:hypothetical protein